MSSPLPSAGPEAAGPVSTTRDAKAALRAEALAHRDALEIDDRLAWDEAIAGHVLALSLFDAPAPGRAAPCVAAYWPMRSEADPRPILVDLAARGFPLCLPVVIAGEVRFRAWQPWDMVVPGGFGTLVPVPDAEPREPDLLIVPLAAFDARGYRLGYGKGHYDRVLTRLGAARPIRAIGIAYAAQQVAEVPTEPHDVTLDAVVTENGRATGPRG
jgi:5-formyltetrahydrofolate cyclo-ligase